MSNLVDYAREELGTAALEIVEVFSRQGHSGGSAAIVTQIVGKLMQYEPLTPLTYAPDEWIKHADDLWQNRRDSRVFSTDGGKTHYSLAEQ